MAGRPKGVVGRKTVDAQRLANELGIDPFEVLLRFTAADWEGLGYERATQTKVTKDGSTFEVDVISPELRAQCAERAAQYLLPKRKAVEFTPADIPDEIFDHEVQRRINLRILKGEKIS